MAKKIHRLKKGNNTIFPVTITDAVVDEETLKTLTELLRDIDSRLKALEDQAGILWG